MEFTTHYDSSIIFLRELPTQAEEASLVCCFAGFIQLRSVRLFDQNRVTG